MARSGRLLPVMRPAKTPTYLKRVVKEKWDEVNRLRKRRVRWAIGGDRIEIDYEVGTNTAALPTVNIIDIVDYYLGAILPSPESVRIDVSSISLPTLTKTWPPSLPPSLPRQAFSLL